MCWSTKIFAQDGRIPDSNWCRGGMPNTIKFLRRWHGLTASIARLLGELYFPRRQFTIVITRMLAESGHRDIGVSVHRKPKSRTIIRNVRLRLSGSQIKAWQ